LPWQEAWTAQVAAILFLGGLIVTSLSPPDRPAFVLAAFLDLDALPLGPVADLRGVDGGAAAPGAGRA
jgi:hypothetical protein